MSEPSLKLPAGADQLLSGFPAQEPDFEAQARAIEARVLGAAKGAESADLLKAPELAAEAGEPALPSSVRSAQAPKSNFAEMARKSLQKKEDDGAALAKELLAATAQSRRPDAEMVERVRAAGKSIAAVPPAVSVVGDAERASGVVTRAEPAAPAPAPAASNHRGTLLGVAAGALAMAACFALYLNTQEKSPTSDAVAAEKAADQRQLDAAKPAPAAAAPVLEAKQEGVVSPEALPAAAAPALEHAPAAKAAVSKAGVAAAAASPAPAHSPAMAAQEAVQLEDDVAPTKATNPSGPAPGAEPPTEALKPAEGTSGSVPLTPSAGAVSTALSSVRANAQSCLAGQTDPVSAVVTFASDGHVLRVTAAGASGPCIQAALSKAHIQPFARESYSAPITVRPR